MCGAEIPATILFICTRTLHSPVSPQPHKNGTVLDHYLGICLCLCLSASVSAPVSASAIQTTVYNHNRCACRKYAPSPSQGGQMASVGLKISFVRPPFPRRLISITCHLLVHADTQALLLTARNLWRLRDMYRDKQLSTLSCPPQAGRRTCRQTPVDLWPPRCPRSNICKLRKITSGCSNLQAASRSFGSTAPNTPAQRPIR